MNLTKLKKIIDKLYEVEENRTKKVVVSCGCDDLCYIGEATSINKSFWSDNGYCITEGDDSFDDYDEEGEDVIEISGWMDE